MNSISSDSDESDVETNRNNEVIQESLRGRAGVHSGNYHHDLFPKDQFGVLGLAVVHDGLDVREGSMA